MDGPDGVHGYRHSKAYSLFSIPVFYNTVSPLCKTIMRSILCICQFVMFLSLFRTFFPGDGRLFLLVFRRNDPG